MKQDFVKEIIQPKNWYFVIIYSRRSKTIWLSSVLVMKASGIQNPLCHMFNMIIISVLLTNETLQRPLRALFCVLVSWWKLNHSFFTKASSQSLSHDRLHLLHMKLNKTRLSLLSSFICTFIVQVLWNFKTWICSFCYCYNRLIAQQYAHILQRY